MHATTIPFRATSRTSNCAGYMEKRYEMDNIVRCMDFFLSRKQHEYIISVYTLQEMLK